MWCPVPGDGVVWGGARSSDRSHPVCQVESLVEQSSPWQERQAVSLPPECLGDSWGSEAPAWTLLEACGLEPQVAAPQVCWEPEACSCACALYACLALLLRLSRLC